MDAAIVGLIGVGIGWALTFLQKVWDRRATDSDWLRAQRRDAYGLMADAMTALHDLIEAAARTGTDPTTDRDQQRAEAKELFRRAYVHGQLVATPDTFKALDEVRGHFTGYLQPRDRFEHLDGRAEVLHDSQLDQFTTMRTTLLNLMRADLRVHGRVTGWADTDQWA